MLAALSLTNMNSVSSESALETSGARGGVTIVLLVQGGRELLNAQQIPKSTMGLSLHFKVKAMDLRATIDGSNWRFSFLIMATDSSRPLTQKLQTLLPQQRHWTYLMLPFLEGVPARTDLAEACWTVSGEQQMQSADHILSDE